MSEDYKAMRENAINGLCAWEEELGMEMILDDAPIYPVGKYISALETAVREAAYLLDRSNCCGDENFFEREVAWQEKYKGLIE